MSLVDPVNIVPSGKVYGQLFEAQAFLNKKLKHLEEKRADLKLKSHNEALNLPLVHRLSDNADKPDVVHKKVQCFPDAKSECSTLSADVCEVKALPEIVVDKRSSSDIVKRIKERRLKLHETSLEDMYQDLGIINSNIEIMLEICCKDFCEKMSEVDKITESLLEIDESDKLLKDYSFEELNKKRADIQSHTEHKLKHIHYLDYQFHEIESSRIAQIKNVLYTYTASLQEIAYLTTPEVYRLMESEVQIINQTLLNNKQSYTDIYTQLLLVSIEQDRKHHLNWKTVTTLWKNQNIQEILERFRHYMLTSASAKPDKIYILLNHINTKFTNILNDYKEHLQFLRNFIPPKCTRALVEEWYGKINKVTEKLRKEKQRFLAKMNAEYEKGNQQCFTKMHEEEIALVKSTACTEDKASELSTKYMLPLIHLQQKNFECSLATWDDDVTREMMCTMKKLKKLYAYISALTDIWLNHTQELENQEHKMNQVLAENRDKHNIENQGEESKLDIILDALRQGASTEVLETNLNAALSILARLKLSYQNFYSRQMSTTTLYLPIVNEKLRQYESELCKFFKLKKYSKIPISPSVLNDECACPDPPESGGASTELPPKASPKVVISPTQQSSKKTTYSSPPRHKSMSSEGYLVTKQSTQYYYEPGSIESISFIDEQDLITKQVHIPSEFISDIKTNICMNMLNHLDLWLVDATKKAKQALAIKTEELDAELGLRIYLHQPRIKRIHEDIHDLRKAELVSHAKRIAEHCQGVENAFTNMRLKLNQIKDSQDAMMADFENQIEAMEIIFLSVSKSEKLVTIRNDLTITINKLMSNIRKVLREYRTDFDKDLQKVKDSNAILMESLKPFSEMGNFCPEEIQQYQKIIEKFNLKVDTFEGKILADMEGMESTRYDQANKITLMFEDKFKNHIFDLQFIELIARWFTNTQVKIKSDVAKCNTQGKSICEILEKLENKIDYLTEPHPDKLKCLPSEMTADLANALTQFCSRAVCLISPKSGRESSLFKLSVLNSPSDIPAISKAGKPWFEDVSVITARNILRGNKLQGSSEGSLLPKGEKSDGTATDAVGSSTNFSADPKMKLNTKKSLTQYASQNTDGKTVFEQMFRLGKVKKILLSHKIRQKLFSGDLEVKESEDGELEVVYDFLGNIRQYLQITFDNVLLIAEDYYRVKGARPVTRPMVIQDNVDSCAILMKKKLKSYYAQATEYITRCQTEFVKQIQQLESIASKIPGLVMNQNFIDNANSIEVLVKDQRKVLEEKLEEFQAKQASNREQLRPNLGHPQMKDRLKQLDESEREQHHAFMDFIQSHFSDLKAEVIKASGPYLKELCTTSESLLQLYDTLFKDPHQKKDSKLKITPSDVYSLVKNIPIHERATWTGLPLKEFYTEMSLESPFSKTISVSITTSKCMFPHHITVKARNETFQMYKDFFKNTLERIEREEKDVLERERKRWANWQASVKNIQNLYK